MLTTRPQRLFGAGAIACTVALTAAGCGMSDNSAQGAHHGPMHHEAAMHHHAMAAPFGPDCAMVPATGMGSFHAMSTEPVLTAAAHNPLLTMFAAEAKKAGLATELGSMHGFTVFAPENTAFAKLGHSAMMMLENPAELAALLKYHVVAGQVTADSFTMAHSLRTLQGGTITPSKMGAVYEVNKADVVCGGIETANATVYIINSVLVPTHTH
jgi:uncharacterized surface protein with fasciclin (FAS1) repeats